MSQQPDFTPLDSLKECAARAQIALANVIKLLDTPGALSMPGMTERAIAQLSELREILCEEAISDHVDMSADDAQRYSDGRQVLTQISLPPDGFYRQVWSANPRSPRDQPQVVVNFRTSSDTHWRIAILRQGELDAIRVENED